MNTLAELRRRFAVALADFTDDPAPFAAMVRPAQDPRFGDFQANCAMPLGKQVGLNPRELALRIVEKLDVADLCEPAEVAGPGFINLRLLDDHLGRLINAVARDERLGVEPVAEPRTIVVDYSGPNVAKPMHVGHLRSTVIGDALYRVLTFLGHQTIGDNHIGDWGTQFGMILYGFKHFLDRAAYERDPVGELARLYRLVNQLSDYHVAREELPKREQGVAAQQQVVAAAEAAPAANARDQQKVLKNLRSDLAELQDGLRSAKSKIDAVDRDVALASLAADHPDIARGARDETAKLHAGDPENTRLWHQFLPQCLAALQQVYTRLGVAFDVSLGESHYQPRLAGVVADLQQKGLAVESEGAMCVFIPGNDAPFIVRKADGAFTYATTDLATIRHRIEDLKADSILYVVDARQADHFKLLFATARRWGYTATELQHISFGTVMGDDGKPFKTRAGDTVGLESLLDEAVAHARAIVDENDDAKRDEHDRPSPELDESTRRAVAEIVGIGGIKYADLRHNRESDYVFSWDKMLAKTGDTATYMQYAYARTRGILRKGGADPDALRSSGAAIAIRHPAERALVLQLCRFPEALAGVAAEYRPNVLTQYLFETANAFSTFFEQCPVIKAGTEELRVSRYLLTDLTGRVIRQALALLGIETCEQM
jgi:arginyl-tRNA synthetase